MKKDILLLSMLTLLFVGATSCHRIGGDGHDPKIEAEQNEIKVKPSIVEMVVGDVLTIGKEGADIIVSITPKDAPFTIESQNPDIVSVKDNLIQARKKGKTSIIIKNGKYKTLLSVVVSSDVKIDYKLYLGQFYVPENFNTFLDKDEKIKIIEAMERKDHMLLDATEKALTFRRRGNIKHYFDIIEYSNGKITAYSKYRRGASMKYVALLKKIFIQIMGFTDGEWSDNFVQINENQKGYKGHNPKRNLDMIYTYQDGTDKEGRETEDCQIIIFPAQK